MLVLLAFGFLALPPLVKHFAAKALSEKFHRTVAIQEVSINPLNLSLRVKGFSMGKRSKVNFSLGTR